MSIDVLNASVAIVLTALVGRFDLSNSELAWGLTLYYVVSALPMPLFGLLADRWQGRWLSQGGVLWTALAFCCAPFAPSYAGLLAILTVGGLGSAAFHACSTRTASLSGSGRRTGASTSVFFFMGQIGLSTGPVITGVMIKAFDLRGVFYTALAVVPVALLMQGLLHRPMARKFARPSAQAAANALLLIGPLLFILYIVLRSATMQNYMSLLPKYFADQGFASDVYGARVGMLVFGGSLGTLLGGVLADRVGRRRIMIWSLWLSVPFLFAMLRSDGYLYYAAAFATGVITNTSHSAIVVQAQSMLPQREGLASGLALGVMFASGAIMTGVAGFAADLWTLSGVMYVLAALPLLTGALLFWPDRGAPASRERPSVAAA